MDRSTTDDFIIRPACKDDCKYIMMLVHELAEYEHLSDQIMIDSEVLERDGFCDDPFFHCVVAECKNPGTVNGKTLVGYALFYFIYSSFQGRSAYLEDIYVSPAYRGQRLGSLMLEKVAQIILKEGCCRLDFVVLQWNHGAMKLYKRLGAEDISDKEQLHVWRLQENKLQMLAATPD